MIDRIGRIIRSRLLGWLLLALATWTLLAAVLAVAERDPVKACASAIVATLELCVYSVIRHSDPKEEA